MLVGGITIGAFIGVEAWNYIHDVDTDPSALTSMLYGFGWNAGIIILSVGYLAGLALLVEKLRPTWYLHVFSTVGQLGLTNYVLHIAFYIIIFKKFEWCLGMSGKIGPFYRLGFALLAYAFLYGFSRLWMTHFKYGPLEWIWRTITYWKLQPLNRNSTKIEIAC